MTWGTDREVKRSEVVNVITDLISRAEAQSVAIFAIIGIAIGMVTRDLPLHGQIVTRCQRLCIHHPLNLELHCNASSKKLGRVCTASFGCSSLMSLTESDSTPCFIESLCDAS